MTDAPTRAAHAWIAAMLDHAFLPAQPHMHPATAQCVRHTIDAHLAAADGAAAPEPAPHQPYRGSDVETFIKRARDQYPPDGDSYGSERWDALNGLLDAYRLHADTGASLAADTSTLGPHPGE
jgi:hypothetical protein